MDDDAGLKCLRHRLDAGSTRRDRGGRSSRRNGEDCSPGRTVQASAQGPCGECGRSDHRCGESPEAGLVGPGSPRSPGTTGPGPAGAAVAIQPASRDGRAPVLLRSLARNFSMRVGSRQKTPPCLSSRLVIVALIADRSPCLLAQQDEWSSERPRHTSSNSSFAQCLTSTAVDVHRVVGEHGPRLLMRVSIPLNRNVMRGDSGWKRPRLHSPAKPWEQRVSGGSPLWRADPDTLPPSAPAHWGYWRA
jgi:hypothetical protein